MIATRLSDWRNRLEVCDSIQAVMAQQQNESKHLSNSLTTPSQVHEQLVSYHFGHDVKNSIDHDLKVWRPVSSALWENEYQRIPAILSNARTDPCVSITIPKWSLQSKPLCCTSRPQKDYFYRPKLDIPWAWSVMQVNVHTCKHQWVVTYVDQRSENQQRQREPKPFYVPRRNRSHESTEDHKHIRCDNLFPSSGICTPKNDTFTHSNVQTSICTDDQTQIQKDQRCREEPVDVSFTNKHSEHVCMCSHSTDLT